MVNTTMSALMGLGKPLLVPGVFDGISARVALELDFPAVYVGSFATTAAKYGLPDLGFIALEDMADAVRRISAVVDRPIIVDGEGGWGNPLHVARAVRTLERAGAHAIHIEDHDFGKHIVANPKLLSVAAAKDKFRAALDSRSNDGLAIIARTDANGDEAIDRVAAYADEGVDGVFVAGEIDDRQWKRLRSEIDIPIISVDFPGTDAQELASRGVDIILYWGYPLFAAHQAMLHAMMRLKESGGKAGIDRDLPHWSRVDEFLGINEFRSDAKRFGLLG